MRHRKRTAKLGVKSAHRKAMLAHIVVALVEHHRIRTTVDRAKEARRLAEKMITLAKRNTLHARRQAIAALRDEMAVKKLFDKISPEFELVQGGYTRIIKEAVRPGDGAQMVYLEFSKNIALEEPKTEKKIKPSKSKKSSLDDVSVVKKDKVDTGKIKASTEKPKKSESTTDKEDEESDIEKAQQKGGFLTSLRKFLKGDEKK